MKKRMLSLLLVAAMVFGLCGPLGDLLPAAQAAETGGTTSEGVEWSYEDGVLTLSGGGIPEAGDFPWLEYKEDIWQVVVGENITQVSAAAFEGLNLGRLIFQSDVAPAFKPTESAFWTAFYVLGKDIFYPDTWTDPDIGGTPYSKARKGSCGPVDKDTGEYSANLTWELVGDTLTISGTGEMADWDDGKYAPWAFYNNEIKHVVIGDGVTSIGDRAFGIGMASEPPNITQAGLVYDYPIESVSLGSSVQEIGYGAFANLDALTAIAIPASVKWIDEEAFIDCTGLVSLTFAEDAQLVYGRGAFMYCTALKRVELPANDTTQDIEDSLCYYSVFLGCESLEEVTFRDGAAYIGSEMFADCIALKEVTIPHSMQAISDDAFWGCENLTDISYDGYQAEWDILVKTVGAEWLENVTVHVTPDTAAPTISNVTGAGIHNSNFTVSATVSDNQPNITVKFEWSTDNAAWTLLKEETISGASGTVEATVDVGGLLDGTIAVRVTATDYAGNPNTYTVEHIIDRTPPAAPVLNDPEAKGPTVVSVTWERPADEDLNIFRLYRQIKDGSGWDNIYSGNVLGYTDESVKPNTTYAYYVTAVDTAGNESDPSETKTVTTPPDGTAPTVVAITPGGGNTIGSKQTIKVHASDDSGLVSVAVEYRAQGETQWSAWKTFTVTGKSTSAPFTLAGLASGTYALRACATDTSGNRSAYSEITYTLDADAPNVTGLTAQAGNEQAELRWTSADSDLAGFYLYRVSNGDSTRIGSVSAAAGQTAYTFTDWLDWSLCGKAYTYRVTAVDLYGNEQSFTSEAVTPATNADTEPPVAVLTAPSSGFAGDSLSFSAAGSSDNRAIDSYEWNFGDGKTAEGKTVTHSYTAGGTFTVTLTVKDDAGNAATQTQTVAVTAQADNTQVNVTVSDDTGASLGRVQVVYDMGGANTSYYTNGGTVSFHTTDIGEVQIGAYASGYLPSAETVTLEHGKDVNVVIQLQKAPVVTGNLTSKELTYEEILDRGLDPTDPDNQNVYEFVATIQIGDNIKEYTYYVNDSVETGTGNIWSCAIQSSGGGGSGYTVGAYVVGGPHTSDDDDTPVRPISYVTVLRLPGTVSMLKQFFEAELTVINQAGQEIAFENCAAQLNVPSGLTIVPTDNTAETASVALSSVGQPSGVISGSSSATARWILRGDKAGAYKLSASFDGALKDFGVPLHAEFTAAESVCVRDPSEVQLDMIVSNVMLDETIYVDLELSCDTSTVNLPKITLGEYEPEEIMLRDDKTEEETDGTGVTSLEPGQTLVYRYAIEMTNGMRVLFVCNLLEGELVADGITANTYTRNITKFKLFQNSTSAALFDMTDMGVFIKTLPEGLDVPFWQFVFNTKEVPSEDNLFYSILRRDLSDYDGTLEELRMTILAMFQDVRAQMNSYLHNVSSDQTGFLTGQIAEYLWEILEEDDGRAARGYVGKKVWDSIRGCVIGMGLGSLGMGQLEDAMLNAETSQDVYNSVDHLFRTIQEWENSTQTPFPTSEGRAIYAYFNHYLNYRVDYEHPGEEGFLKLLEEEKAAIIEQYVTEIDPDDRLKHEKSLRGALETREKWAEAMYQFEVVALGYQSGGDAENEEVVLTYRSDSLGSEAEDDEGGSINRTERYEYNWKWFENPGTQYNQKLASLTLGMVMAGFTDPDTDELKDSYLPQVQRAANIQKAYKDLGFDNVKYFNYDKPLSDTSDKAAFSIASRQLEDGSTLVAVFTRGGGYGGEWVSNFHVGWVYDHEGFRIPAEQVVSEVKQYLEEQDVENVKLWMGGFSRAAAVTNIAAHNLLADEVVAPENMFAYTFATPKGHYGANTSELDSGIYNIVSPHDLVPVVALKQWGFGRYGTTLYLPIYNSPLMESYFEKQTDSSLAVTAETRYTIETLEAMVALMITNRNQYTYYIQSTLMDTVDSLMVSDAGLAEIAGNIALTVIELYRSAIWEEGWIEAGGWIIDENGNIIDKGDGAVDVIEKNVDGMALAKLAVDAVLALLKSRDLDEVKAAHNPEYYQAWLQAGSLRYTTNYTGYYSRRSLLVECPVDVEVYDAQDKLVAKIVDNEVVQADVPAAVVGDAKVVYLYDGDYSVKLTGTDEGIMAYTVREYDEYQTVGEQRYYELPLTAGCVYTQFIDSKTGGSALTDAAGQTYLADRETNGTETTVRRNLIGVSGGTAEHVAAAPGERVSVTADAPAQGMVFDHWEVISDADGFALANANAVTTEFTMPDGAVFLTAVYREKSTGSGSSSGSSSGGSGSSTGSAPGASVSGSGGKVSASDDGTVTITPEEGYQIGSITVNGEKVAIPADGKLTGLGADDRVVVIFEEDVPTSAGVPFADVAPGAWYADAVQYVYENGIMSGTDTAAFSPTLAITRAMVVAMLYRMEGQPDAGDSGFADVPANAYYADAVAWAKANGIVSGASETAFAPDAPVTREQIAAILYRYASYKGYDVTASGSLEGYTDAPQISAYAAGAMRWANARGLIVGNTSTTLNPRGNATRAEVAAILMRFRQDIVR